MINKNKISNLLNNYYMIKMDSRYNEQYKWDFLEKNSDKFRKKINQKKLDDNYMQSIININLLDVPRIIYQIGEIIKNTKDLFFNLLYNLLEDADNLTEEELIKRINKFDKEIKNIIKKYPAKMGPINLGLRTYAFFLTLYNPQKFGFYKNTEFEKFMKIINPSFKIERETVGELYIEYLKICNEIKDIMMSNNFHFSKYSLLDVQDFWFSIIGYSDVIEKMSPTEREIMNILKDKRQIILYGPPGTGKTYIAKKISTKLIRGEF